MALSFQLDSTAVGQADDVFYCLYNTAPDIVDGKRQPISGTSQAEADKKRRSDWCAIYEQILAHNTDGSQPFPECRDTEGHNHHPADCAHCAPTVDDPVDDDDTDDDDDNNLDDNDDDKPDDICEECQKAYLKVIVKDEDGNRIDGALVNVTARGDKTTTPKGVSDYGQVPVGTYDVTADKNGHGPSSTGPTGQAFKSAVSVPAGTKTVVTLILHPILKVVIVFTVPVACPGHPFEMTASGTPSGGTYTWSVENHDARISDTAGGAPATVGPKMYMQCFKPDDATGTIPERKVLVKVTYDHPTLGTVAASAYATVHKIDFDVTNDAITMGGIQANEQADTAAGANDGTIQTWNTGGIATMSCDPEIEIKLGANCPRKADCAQNHEAGWLQTMLTDTRQGRYSESLFTNSASVSPIRDAMTGTPTPWYDVTSMFLNDGDKFPVHHEDSPNQNFPGADWRVAAPGAPITNRNLRSITYTNSFHAWLSVRNTDWEQIEPLKSFVYVRNFSWQCSLSSAVDMTQAVGSRCATSSNPATGSALSAGKGGVAPILTGPIWNDDQAQTIVAAPAIP